MDHRHIPLSTCPPPSVLTSYMYTSTIVGRQQSTNMRNQIIKRMLESFRARMTQFPIECLQQLREQAAIHDSEMLQTCDRMPLALPSVPVELTLIGAIKWGDLY